MVDPEELKTSVTAARSQPGLEAERDGAGTHVV
jgi:hypothetical protein